MSFPPFDFITPRIAIGSRAHTWALRAERITHVINARQPPDPIRGFVTLHNPTNDDGQPKGAAYWRATVSFALNALADPAARLYVHCKAGKHRSAGHAYAILRALGHPQDEAWAMIAAARPRVRPVYRADVDRFFTEQERAA